VACGEEAFFDSNGVKIRYLIEGNGAAVVLLHGFAAGAEMWDGNPQTKVFSELAKEFRVIAPDCRGHGKSDKPHYPKLYGKEMIEDVVRLLDHLRIKKAHVVGYSMGAELAGHLLVAHPDRLLSVTMGGGVPAFEPSPESLALVDLAAKSLDEGKGIGPLIMAGTPPGAPKLTPGLADAISRSIIGDQDQKALAASVRGGKDLEVRAAQLETNRVPVLVVYGSMDLRGENLERLKRVARLLNARTQVIEGGSHAGSFASPAFLEVVRTFIREHQE